MAPNNPMHEKPFEGTFDEVLETIMSVDQEEAAKKVSKGEQKEPSEPETKLLHKKHKKR